jgi:tight adherence protein B
MRLFLATVVFALVLAAITGLAWIVRSLRRREKQRHLRAFLKTAPESPPSTLRSDTSESDRPTPTRFFSGLLDLARLETLLTSADVSLSPERFLILAGLAGTLGFFAVLAVSQNLLGAMLAMALATGLPLLMLLHRRRQRDEALVRQMPDALDMIVRALRVGQSVDNALKEVARSCPPPLGMEIRTIYEEMALGIPFTAALQNFEARFARLADVKLMTTAFIIQRETGGNLTRVLANLSDLIRDRDTLKRQVRAMTAEGRSSAFILGILPLAVGAFFWLIRPAYIQMLFTHPVGRKLLLAAVMLELSGFVVMKLMTRIDA